MKLYMHPISMTSRPVRLFLADNKIDCEEEVVDLMTGAHHQSPTHRSIRTAWCRCWLMAISS
jgi:glutathione S-transferase